MEKVFYPEPNQKYYIQDLELPVFYDHKSLNDWMDHQILGLLPNIQMEYQIVNQNFDVKNKTFQIINQNYKKTEINDFLDHIIESFIQNNQKIIESELDETDYLLPYLRTIRKLLAIKSNAPIWNKNSILHLIQKIYQNQIWIQKVPEDGDCYFHSIGVSTNQSAKQVRDNIANVILDGSDDESIIIGECKNKPLYQSYQEKISKLSDLIRIMCDNKGKDCNDCLWGSSSFNHLVQDIYQRPVIVIEIEPNDFYPKKSVFRSFEKIKWKNMESQNLFQNIYERFLLDDDSTTLKFDLTPPTFRVLLQDDDLQNPIGLIFHLAHYNAFILK